jgi:hypothetical protein
LAGWDRKGDTLESYLAAERLHDAVNLYQGGGLLNSILGNRSDRFVLTVEITVRHRKGLQGAGAGPALLIHLSIR